jgi:nickel-dependent lactate racemase
MLYYARGGAEEALDQATLEAGLQEALERLGRRRKVIAVPPDITRLHSRAGALTAAAYQYYGAAMTDVMPALGTHAPMTASERRLMYPEIPDELFRVHDWTRDLATLGEVPAQELRRLSEGKLDFPWPAQVNERLLRGGYDLILSIGQVVPHEVIGMANYNKNIFVGTGGREGINKSHYLGAVYGMERIMGRADTPVRELMNYASEHFAADLPIVYALTVVGRGSDGELATKGLFVGDDAECFYRAAELAKLVNTTAVRQPLDKVVVWLDHDEYKSTWLGNKAIYRTRMAIADGGELIVIAPGVQRFGESGPVDGLIRRYGYIGTERVLSYVKKKPELQENLGTAAHLIHGSSEGRFRVRYCPGGLTREEVEGVGFEYGDFGAYARRYDPARMREGFNRMDDGEEIYFISNPAVGLWYAAEKDIG